MPIYANGRTGGRSGESSADVVKRISEAIMENGRIGDLSRFSAADMVYVRIAMKGIADSSVNRIFSLDMLTGVDIGRVTDIVETVRHLAVEE